MRHAPSSKPTPNLAQQPACPATPLPTRRRAGQKAWPTPLLAALIAAGLGLSHAAPAAQAAPMATPAAAAAKASTAAADPLVWDLSPLFASDAAWDAERRAVQAALPAMARLRGTLDQSAAALRRALSAQSALSQRMERLSVYASAQISTDVRDARNQERDALMSTLWGEFGEAVAWMAPEVQALGRTRVEAFLKADRGLAVHAVGLRDTLRLARHTLSAQTESALAALDPVLTHSGQTRSLLVDSDMTWPTLTIDGQPTVVDDTRYGSLRQHPDRAVREQVFKAFFSRLGQYQNTFGSTLVNRMRAGTIQAKLRQHPSAVSASLSANQVPESVYRTLVAQAHTGLPLLHRYFKLRQRLLKLPDLHYHDLYPDLVKLDRSFPVEESARLTQRATEVLGPDYQRLMKRALGERSMHVKPAPGKSSGAYQTGVYGQIPLVFLNHVDDFDSASTFAHEWGHGLHTLLANESQPYELADYSLFVAEVASITNEVLLSEHLLAQSSRREERLFYLNQALEQMRTTFFRQTMFAEFELAAHDALERGEGLTGQQLTGLYCRLMRQYHGSDAGVVNIDPQVCTEWAYIPHFYGPFYVYQYATSMAAASYFGQNILAGQPGLRDTYLGVLRAGGSVPPYELLKKAGVDLASPVPYQALLQRMGRALDEMERLLDQPGG